MATDKIKEAADFFWRAAGHRETFPRQLEEPATWGLPVAIVKLPRLWGADVREYLARTVKQNVSLSDSVALKGFMIAAAGKGLLFVNGSDPGDEQRYSLAHEIAHFLLEYHLPRLRTIELLGPQICEVLDGQRPATIEERVHAILARAPASLYEYRIGQFTDKRSAMLARNQAEDDADALAVELLAPSDVIIYRATKWRRKLASDALCVRLRKMLIRDFGLPEFAADGLAEAYSSRLAKPTHVKQWLGISK
jgi:hypothetical protein